jgi:hypothetical protein
LLTYIFTVVVMGGQVLQFASHLTLASPPTNGILK